MKWGDWGACQTVNEERNRNLKKTNASLKDVRPTVSRSGLGTVSMKQNFEKLRMDQLFTYFIHDSRPDCGICRSVEDMWKSREGLVHLPKRLILIRETAVAILAYQLLHHCMEDSAARSESDLAGDIQQKSLAQEKEQLESKIEGLKRRIAYLNDPDTDDDALLKVEPLRFPSYREDNTATFNSAMRLLLSHDLPLEELLKKVCYNLLISKSPPDVHTLNVLILRLCHAGHVRPAWSVIHALFDCQIAPNEVTIAAILTFYTVTDDLSGFVAFVGHFATPGPVDLVAHPRKVPDYAKRPESFKATNHSILISRLDYFSLATRSELSAMGRQRSQEIQEALIIGWLKFKSIKEAHLEYERMGMLGFWKASPELIEAVDWLCENIGTASCNGAISGAALKLKLETEALLLKWNAEMQCLRAEMHALESSAATETPESDVALHETEKGDPGTESMENDRAQEIQPKVHHVWERSRPFQRWINISTNPDVPIYLEYRRSSMAIQESEFFALMTAFRRSRWLTEHQLLDLAPEASAETIHMTRQNQTRKIYEETVPYKPLLRPSFLEAQRQYERATVVPMDTCNPRISKVIRGYS
jgi:cell division protein FtsB